MPETFDAYRYARYLGERWRWIAAASATAALAALIVSLLVPKQYTSVARVLVGPPGLSDARNLTLISPVYLESLRTYEHFALGDSLFAEAVKELDLATDHPGQDPGALKRAALDIAIPRNTRVIEIEATLGEPRKAQALAQFIAERTIEMSASVNSAGDEKTIDRLTTLRDEQAVRLREAESTLAETARRSPVGGLEEELAAAIETRLLVEHDRLRTEADIAEIEADEASPRASAARAREQKLAVQLGRSDERISALRTRLATRGAEHDRLQTEIQSARAALNDAGGRLDETRALAGRSGERLQLLDPGLVPQRPSSPNKLLNMLVATALAFAFSILLLSFRFSLSVREPGADSR